ncbi:hypothetical protein BC332_34781 [Capsicum chinense]|nr:hypothetical protein BC332_34781 [Capsicum chinense]
MAGLPKQYEAYMLSISCKSEDELTLEDVKSKLYLAEKQEKLQKETEARDKEKALYSRKHQQQPSKKNFKNSMKSRNQNRSGTTSGNDSTMQQGGESAKIVILDNKSETDDEELIALTIKKDKTRKGIKSMWIVDSGATHHMTPFIDILVDFDETIKGSVVVADERKTSVEGKGNVVLKLAEKYGNKNLKLNDVSFVPNLDCNLLSVKQLDKRGFKCVFQNCVANIFKDDKLVITAYGLDNNLYQFQCDKITSIL